MRHSFAATAGEVYIRELRQEDIELLRQWRNDPENSQYLTKIKVITEEMQKEWFASYLSDDDTVFFVICAQNIGPIGTVALYGFEGDCCLIGKLLIGEKRNRGFGYAEKAFCMAMNIGIHELGIRKYRLFVYEENEKARSLYERIGFRVIRKTVTDLGMTELEMVIEAKEILMINLQITLNSNAS